MLPFFGMDDDARDPLGRRQPHVRPGLAAVGRFVDAVADRDRVAGPAFAGADPHHSWRRSGSSATAPIDLHRLLVEHRLEGRPAVLATSTRRPTPSRPARSPCRPSPDGRRRRRFGPTWWPSRCCGRRGRRWRRCRSFAPRRASRCTAADASRILNAASYSLPLRRLGRVGGRFLGRGRVCRWRFALRLVRRIGRLAGVALAGVPRPARFGEIMSRRPARWPCRWR